MIGYANAIFTRQILAAHAIYCLNYPIPRKEFKSLNNKIFYDFPNSFVILRCMYETLIMANYLLISDKFKKVRNVILKVASLHAIKEQIILLENMQSSKKEFQELIKERGKLFNDIKNHHEYTELDDKIKKYIDNYEGKNKKWYSDKLEHIAVLAGFHKTQHLQYNKYFSNYIHSDPFSMKQVIAVRSPFDAKLIISFAKDCTINFLSMTLDLIKKIYNKNNILIEISEKSQKLINEWKYINHQDISKNK